MAPEPIRQDQSLEHLRQQVAKLTHALEIIDRDADRMAAKYLHSTVERGYLKFADFLELLVLEIRRDANTALTNTARFRHLMAREIELRVKAELERRMPAVEGTLEQLLKIQAVVLPDRVRLDREGTKKNTGMRAHLLCGNMKWGRGSTAEEAILDLKHRLTIELLSMKGDSHAMLSFFKARDRLMAEYFARATPHKVEEIAGFKVEVRILGGEPGGKS